MCASCLFCRTHVFVRMFVAVLGEIPGLFKADIDAAFRRIPIKPAHRWACGITFRALNKVRTFASLLRGQYNPMAARSSAHSILRAPSARLVRFMLGNAWVQPWHT
mgnify:FL=1